MEDLTDQGCSLTHDVLPSRLSKQLGPLLYSHAPRMKLASPLQNRLTPSLV